MGYCFEVCVGGCDEETMEDCVVECRQDVWLFLCCYG